MLSVLLLYLSITHAEEHSVACGFGRFYGGTGLAYTYEPLLGLGFQVGAGTNGLSLAARWDPTWLTAGYAQAGLVRAGDGYHPSMVVGTHFGEEVFLDVNAGVAVSLGGSWWPTWDVGVGMRF